MSNEVSYIDTKIVDEIIHYLKSNIAGHIDRDNVVDVLIKYVEDDEDSDDKLKEMKDEIKRIISDLEGLV